MTSGILGPHPLRSLIPPMEPLPLPPPGKEPPQGFPWQDPGFAFQPKWDGIRMLAFLSRGRVRLQNRRLRDRTAAYPELAALPQRIRAREAILDGEVVVLVNGRPSFPAVMRREGSSLPKIPSPDPAEPLVYAVFDLLYLEGRDLSGSPWEARQEILSSLLAEGEFLHLTGSTADGPALWAAIVRRGLEGVVAKRTSSPYLPGKSRHWLKIKVRRRKDLVVGGFTRVPEGMGALLCGLYPAPSPGPGLWYVGRVGTGFSSALRRALAEGLAGLEIPEPPFVNPPRPGPLEIRWTAPLLTVTVEFAEWTEELKLRAPSFIGFSRVEPEECIL